MTAQEQNYKPVVLPTVTLNNRMELINHLTHRYNVVPSIDNMVIQAHIAMVATIYENEICNSQYPMTILK